MTEGSALTMEILDRHVELATWAESQDAAEHMEQYLEMQERAEKGRGFQTGAGASGEVAAARLAEELGYAETYWVSPDMADVIEQAVGTVGVSPLHASDPPSRFGLIQFPRPMGVLVDEHDRPWGPVAVSWTVLDDAEGTGLTSWQEPNGELHQSPGIGIKWW